MRVLMTRKSCAVGMRNAILRNYLRVLGLLEFLGLFDLLEVLALLELLELLGPIELLKLLEVFWAT